MDFRHPGYWLAWIVLMALGDRWHLFADNWFMTVNRLYSDGQIVR